MAALVTGRQLLPGPVAEVEAAAVVLTPGVPDGIAAVPDTLPGEALSGFLATTRRAGAAASVVAPTDLGARPGPSDAERRPAPRAGRRPSGSPGSDRRSSRHRC